MLATMKIDAHPRATAVQLGFTIPKLIEIGMSSLAVLTHPATDFDDRFKCFDMDNGEWLIVNGWMADFISDLD
jgi:hypothetical protein